MPRFTASLVALAVVTALCGGSAIAQSSMGDKSKMDQAGQKKMKTSEDPASPAMQQAAAKQADCKKQAKAKKITGAPLKTFMADCTK